jgi:hypothetical protein
MNNPLTRQENGAENAPLPTTLKGARDYRIDADDLTGAIFIWSLAGPPKILGCVFPHEQGDAPEGAPPWSATVRDIVIARGVGRERAVGALILFLWEENL